MNPLRINRYVAQTSGLSRRAADQAVADGRVAVNGQPATTGQVVGATDRVTLDSQMLHQHTTRRTIRFHKPAGYVVSRDGQGSATIYELLPPELHHLKPVGRLDKYSSGLLLLTDDGELANQLTHPRYQKTKRYEVTLNKPLQPLHHQMISDIGIMLDDGRSKLQLERQAADNPAANNQLTDSHRWQVIMHEGRNRQIRRTFAALGYHVTRLHRTDFGSYRLDNLPSGKWQDI